MSQNLVRQRQNTFKGGKKCAREVKTMQHDRGRDRKHVQDMESACERDQVSKKGQYA